ncbi:MAG: hypothetical protein RL136_1464 [Planctomycetota bacterium]|jgi:uncharacterized membrane protein
MQRAPSEGTSNIRVEPRPKRSGAGRFFMRGLGVVLPSVLTLWILVAAFRFVDSNIAAPINAGMRFVIATAADASDAGMFAPSAAQLEEERTRAQRLRLDDSDEAIAREATRANVDAWWASRWYLDLTGLALAIAAVYLLGRLVGGFVGRKLLAAFESGVLAVPGIRSLYPALKQVVEFLFGGSSKKMNFSRVVMIEYPRPGLWQMGLVTGDATPEIAAACGDSVTVFVPNSPAPFSGWTVTVPRAEVREIPMTVDEALRYLVSAGVVAPSGDATRGTPPPPVKTA